MLIFVFSMIGVFALLFGSIPGDFFRVSMTSSIGVDPEVAEYYAMANVTMYSNTGLDNMTFPYSSMDHSPTAPDWEAGLPTGQYFEVWWEQYLYAPRSLQFRHTTEVWWGRDTHIMTLYHEDGVTPLSPYGYNIIPGNYEQLYNDNLEACVVEAKCEHLSANAIIGFNTTKYNTWLDAWNGGELNYVLSYEYDWNQTNINAWTILGQLLTFQSPDLGIPGVGGTIFNTLLAIPFWIMVAILIIKLVQSMIPFIKGTED